MDMARLANTPLPTVAVGQDEDGPYEKPPSPGQRSSYGGQGRPWGWWLTSSSQQSQAAPFLLFQICLTLSSPIQLINCSWAGNNKIAGVVFVRGFG